MLRTLRARAAILLARAATFASRATGRGAGGMIGGLVAHALDPTIMGTLCAGRPTLLVTGTNGKSTTTRMVVAALAGHFSVATNDRGDNMDAGIISALLASPQATHCVMECDELHVPSVADTVHPMALIVLNLSRDQLDRVGEINTIERALRDGVARHPDMWVIANADDPLVASIAFDHPKTLWVSAGAGWHGDSGSCPRTGSCIVRTPATDESAPSWHALSPLPDGREFCRPTPAWSITPQGILRHAHGDTPEKLYPLTLSLPGRANRGNALHAVATAVDIYGIDPHEAIQAVENVTEVVGRYRVVHYKGRNVHILLAKNPASWQESLSMVDRSAPGVVIAANGQIADGVDLSWLWDVEFEQFANSERASQVIVASGQRATDVSVRLSYARIDHSTVPNMLEAIASCPPGDVEFVGNYTVVRDLNRYLAQHTEKREPEEKC